MRLSIVTTLYYSEKYFQEFTDRISSVAKKITEDYEIIFVNDGSPDNSLIESIKAHENDFHVKVVDLARNMGHHKAIMVGLEIAKGDYVFLIDIDLEEEPELLNTFWEHMQKNPETDVAYGVQIKRKGNWLEKITGTFFYKIFNYFSAIKIPENFITARLMTRKYLGELLKYKEKEIFLGGIWMDVGFNQMPISVVKHGTSPTTYNISKKIDLFVNALTSFSNIPLIYIFYSGVMITLISFVYVIDLFYEKLFHGITIEGWTSLIVSIWLLGGINLFCIGIVGIYLSKVFTEVKNRPYSIIKKIYSKDEQK